MTVTFERPSYSFALHLVESVSKFNLPESLMFDSEMAWLEQQMPFRRWKVNSRGETHIISGA